MTITIGPKTVEEVEAWLDKAKFIIEQHDRDGDWKAPVDRQVIIDWIEKTEKQLELHRAGEAKFDFESEE